MNLRIYINDTDISSTILSLGDVVCESETRNIWEYRLDVYNFTVHIDLLTLLNLTVANYHQLEKKTVEVYYKNILLFSGIIAAVKYSYLKKTLEIAADSLALLSVKSKPYPQRGSADNHFKTSTSKIWGDSLDTILSKLVSNINYNLQTKDFQNFLTGFETNIIDFTRYKSLKGYPILIQNGIRKFRGIFFRNNYPNPYLVFTTELARMNYNVAAIEFTRYAEHFRTGLEIENTENDEVINMRLYYDEGERKLYQVDESGRTGNLVFWEANNSAPNDYLAKTESLYGEDYEMNGFVSYDPEGDSPETGFLAINLLNEQKTNYVIRFVRNEEDRFDYNYGETVTSGQIMKDFAVLTDSIFWISPEGKLIYQNREERASQQISISSELLSDYQSETLTYDTKSIDLPDEVIIGDGVKAEVIRYYQNILSTRILRTYIQCPFWAINQNPMLAQVIIDGYNNIGIVKRFVLGNDEMITITAEKRI